MSRPGQRGPAAARTGLRFVRGDEAVVPASVVTVAVLLEPCRQADEGLLDPAAAGTVPVASTDALARGRDLRRDGP